MEKYIDDKILIKRIKNKNCSDSIQELRNRHIGLIFNIHSRYVGVLRSLNFSPHDFNDEINYLVYNSAKTFNLRKNIKFSSWLGNQTRFLCLNKINELNKRKTVDAEPSDIIKLMDECNKNTSEDNTKQKELCEYLFSILEQLQDKRIIEIFNLRYFNGDKKKKMKWQDIGDKLSLSAQGVINLHKKGVSILKNKLTSTKFFDKI